MAKIIELEYDVREGVRQLTDDSDISSRYIMYLWGNKRSKFLRNDLNNLQKTIDTSILQTLCLEIEEVNINQCNIDYDCETILRTKRPIPKPLELHLKSAIVSVKPTNRTSLPFNFTNKQRAIFSKYSKFNKSIYAFLDDDMYIYLISELPESKLIDCITITGIFENPLDLKDYKNCCGCDDAKPCFDEANTEYPLQSHHIDTIRDEIINTLTRSLQIPKDEINNASDI